MWIIGCAQVLARKQKWWKHWLARLELVLKQSQPLWSLAPIWKSEPEKPDILLCLKVLS